MSTSVVPVISGVAEKPMDFDIHLNESSGFKYPDINPMTQVRLIEIQEPDVRGTIRCRFHIAEIHRLQESGAQLENSATGECCDTPDSTMVNSDCSSLRQAKPAHVCGKQCGYMRQRAATFNTTNESIKLEFFALSYTWGTAKSEEDLHSIFIDDQLFRVRTNLWNFLKTASKRVDLVGTFIFIDALAIDQSNLDEKGYQVALMDLIYSIASKVLIWLGVPAEDDIHLHHGLQSLYQRETWATTNHGENEAENHALKCFSQCTYWERAWIVQEVLLARETHLIYGQYEFPWAKVESLQPKLYDPQSSFLDDATGSPGGHVLQGARYFLEGRSEFMANSAFFRIIQHKLKWRTRYERPNSLLPLHEIMFAFSSQKCLQPRDRLFSILGIVDNTLVDTIRPDYRSDIAEIYENALSACILSIALHTTDPLRRIRSIVVTAIHLHQIFEIDEEVIRNRRKNVLLGDSFLDEFMAPVRYVRTSRTHERIKMRDLLHPESINGPHKLDCNCSQFQIEDQKSRAEKLVDLLSSLPTSCDTTKELDEFYRRWTEEMLGYHPSKSGCVPPTPRVYPASFDLRFQYEESVLTSANSSLLEFEFNELQTTDPIDIERIRSITTSTTVLLRMDKDEPGKYQMASRVTGPNGSYLLRLGLESEEECDERDKKLIVRSETTGQHDFALSCNGCRNRVFAVLYRCLECTNYCLCYGCYQNAAIIHHGHRLEAIYDMSPVAKNFLATNFFRASYHFEDSLLDNFFKDPDEISAIQGIGAGGLMFPWKPRIGMDPPYWVCNLDCTSNVAAEGTPHIRCMGLRLRETDPVDMPPPFQPPGYRYFGGAYIEIISKHRQMMADIIGEDILMMPRLRFAELSRRHFDIKIKEFKEENPEVSLNSLPATGVMIPLGVQVASDVEGSNDERSKRQLPGVGIWVPIGPISDEQAFLTIRLENVLHSLHDYARRDLPRSAPSIAPSVAHLKELTEGNDSSSQIEPSIFNPKHSGCFTRRRSSPLKKIAESVPYSGDFAWLCLRENPMRLPSFGAPVAKLCHVSEPVFSNPVSVRFTIVSHDQGWCNDKGDKTWTWFEAAIIRNVTEFSGSQKIDAICENVDDFAPFLADQGWNLVPVSTRPASVKGKETELQSKTSLEIVRNSISSRWQNHEVVWHQRDKNDEGGFNASFVEALQEGDRIAIWARAHVSLEASSTQFFANLKQFPGWCNYVQSIKTEIAGGQGIEEEQDELLQRAIALSLEEDESEYS